MKTLTAIVSLLILSAETGLAQGRGSSVTQSVTIEVKPITRIAVNGNPTPLIINDAVPGLPLTTVSDNSTKYSLVTNLDQMKIVASIDNPMPAGTRLLIHLSSSKAASAGAVDLSAARAPVDVVRGIGRGSDTDQSISYTFAADAAVGEVPTQSRIITLTLTN